MTLTESISQKKKVDRNRLSIEASPDPQHESSSDPSVPDTVLASSLVTLIRLSPASLPNSSFPREKMLRSQGGDDTITLSFAGLLVPVLGRVP